MDDNLDLSSEPMKLAEEDRILKETIRKLIRRKKQVRRKLKTLGVDLKTTDSKYLAKPISLYVLFLDDECWYIGMSRNVERRFKQHLKGKGAKWTQIHKPQYIVETKDTGLNSDSKASKLEDALTLEYASKYGPDRVRGGGFCQVLNPTWPATLDTSSLSTDDYQYNLGKFYRDYFVV